MSLLNRNCREATKLILERENRRLGAVERVALRLHLGICEMCSRFTRQVDLMNGAMARWKAYSEDDGPEERDAGDAGDEPTPPPR